MTTNLEIGKTLLLDGDDYVIIETEYDEKGIARITILRIDRWDKDEA